MLQNLTKDDNVIVILIMSESSVHDEQIFSLTGTLNPASASLANGANSSLLNLHAANCS